MGSISLFLDIANFANFRLKNADVTVSSTEKAHPK